MTKEYVWTKTKKNNSPWKNFNEQVNNLPDKKFKAIVTRMLTELSERDHYSVRIFYQRTGKYNKGPVRAKEYSVKWKTSGGEINSRLNNIEECICHLENANHPIRQKKLKKQKTILL